MSTTLRPTFTGFVATTIDAAYLVEATAVAGILPRLENNNRVARTLVESGAVLVYGAEYRRWKDGRKWSDGRNLKNGFNIYRELATDPAERMTREELRSEVQKKEELYPFLNSHVGCENSKRNGLIKKAIKLEVGGQQWGLVAYYTLADALAGNLARPRSSPLGPQLVAWGLSPDFFKQPRKAARTAVMTDDDGMSSVANWKSWYKAPRVVRAQYPRPNAAPAPGHQHQQPGQTDTPSTPTVATTVRNVSPDSGVDVDSPAACSPPSDPYPTTAAAVRGRRQQQRQRGQGQWRQREQYFRGCALNRGAVAPEAAVQEAVLSNIVIYDAFMGAEEPPGMGLATVWWEFGCE